jgi:hypothetical protein
MRFVFLRPTWFLHGFCPQNQLTAECSALSEMPAHTGITTCRFWAPGKHPFAVFLAMTCKVDTHTFTCGSQCMYMHWLPIHILYASANYETLACVCVGEGRGTPPQFPAHHDDDAVCSMAQPFNDCSYYCFVFSMGQHEMLGRYDGTSRCPSCTSLHR